MKSELTSDINTSLANLMQVDGAMDCCSVDYTSGMVLGKSGGGVDFDMAGAGNTQVVRAKMETMKNLGISGDIEDLLITLTNQIHIIRPTTKLDGLFIYLVLGKNRGNLALARRKVQEVENVLRI